MRFDDKFGKLFKRGQRHDQVDILGVAAFHVLKQSDAAHQNVFDLTLTKQRKKLADGLDQQI